MFAHIHTQIQYYVFGSTSICSRCLHFTSFRILGLVCYWVDFAVSWKNHFDLTFSYLFANIKVTDTIFILGDYFRKIFFFYPQFMQKGMLHVRIPSKNVLLAGRMCNIGICSKELKNKHLY